MATREMLRAVTGQQTTDGAGVRLIRVLGRGDVKDIDPFLMLDAFDSENPDDYIRGFPLHPHRGIETVTYLIDGRIDHRDSLGNSGTIGAGESQWMTAGSGIMHEEMPQKSDRLRGLQLWVNLAGKDKMTAPAYFDIRKDMIRTAAIPGGSVRVLSGEFGEAKGVEPRFVKASIFDISLEAGNEMNIPTDPENNLFVYVIEGAGTFGSDEVPAGTAGIFGKGDSLSARAGDKGVRFMVVHGRPLGEPIAWGGPIVMNTDAEIRTAFMQLRDGTFIAKAPDC